MRTAPHPPLESTPHLTPGGPKDDPETWKAGWWYYILFILPCGDVDLVGFVLLIITSCVSKSRIAFELQKRPATL